MVDVPRMSQYDRVILIILQHGFQYTTLEGSANTITKQQVLSWAQNVKNLQKISIRDFRVHDYVFA
jgi:hypothetical protein